MVPLSKVRFENKKSWEITLSLGHRWGIDFCQKMTDFGTFECAEHNCAVQENLYCRVFEIWAIDWERPLQRGMNYCQINN